MKLFVDRCDSCQSKIYLKNVAITRTDLRRQIGFENFHLRCGTCQNEHIYSIYRVFAESEKTSTATGAVVGGLLGLLGGPVGLLIGGGLGAAIGGADDTEEQRRVDNFNESW
jgi:hypothetical protein